MPGGGKGSSPAGQTTTTTVNPTQQAQLPFLQGGWGAAEELYRQPYNYYGGQTLATPNFWLPTGYNELAAAGANAGTMMPQMMSDLGYLTAGGGGMQNSPAAPGLSAIGYGGNPFLTQVGAFTSGLSELGNQAAANPYSGMLAGIAGEAAGPNDAMDALRKTSSGAYLNSNPYLDQMFGSASDAVTRAYQTATAPQTASNFAGAGRYGSGAYANSVSQNQQDLGSSLGNLSANIYGGNYQAERARQDAASQSLGALIAQNLGLRGSLTNAAGSQYLQGLQQAASDMAAAGGLDIQALGAQQNALNTMQGGYQAGNANQLAALGLAPSMMQAQYAPAQAMIQAGQGLTGLEQQVLSDAEKRFYGMQQAPWTNLNQYMNAIGQPTTGSGSVTQPYFQNQAANLLGGATGALGLYNGLNSAGLFGSAASAPAGWAAGTGAGSGIFTNLATGATSDIAGSAFPGVVGGLGKGLGKMSDRRVKRDINRVGVLPNGLSLYSFRYLWSDEPQLGLMADEVERIHPAAVLEGPAGFKMVNYELAVQ